MMTCFCPWRCFIYLLPACRTSLLRFHRYPAVKKFAALPERIPCRPRLPIASPAAAAAAAAAMDQKQGMTLAFPRNPLAEIQRQIKHLESRFHTWAEQQPPHIEAAVEAATGALHGGAVGGLLGTLTSEFSFAFPVAPNQAAVLTPDAMASFKRAQAFAGSPLVQARNIAVMTGTNAGISCFLKRVRGVDDFQNSMAAGFGSGVLFSLVSGIGGPNPVAGAVSSGIALALGQGLMFMLGKKFSQPQPDNILYSRTKSMLTDLGLENYEKNFKKGQLTDNTLPLLTDSALSDVRIPPGPRLLILDHIHRDPELTKGRQ